MYSAKSKPYSKGVSPPGANKRKQQRLSQELNTQNQKCIPYAIKPLHYTIPKDVDIKATFIQMLNNATTQIKDIKPFPQSVKIRRGKIAEKIKAFVAENNLPEKTAFDSVFLFDFLCAENNTGKKRVLKTMEEIATAALVLTVKFTFGENNIVGYGKYKEVFDGRSFTVEELYHLEIALLKLVGYKLNYTTPFDILKMFFLNGIVFNILTQTISPSITPIKSTTPLKITSRN